MLDFFDHHVFDNVYPESWARDDTLRQFISLYTIVNLGGALVYLIPAILNYYLIFDHSLMRHKLFLPNQVRLEIECALKGVPWMALPTTALFVMEIKGHSKLYDSVNDHGGYVFLALSFLGFLLFTDCTIYWIHRWLHIPFLYKPLHKVHHKWKVPSPFASHAFHPIDGFLQSVPYHIYPFLFSLHKALYLCLFIMVNLWSTSIHDHNFQVPRFLQRFVNGCAHHTDHHLYFTCNYGEYFTLWDRLGGSFRDPSAYNGDDVHNQVDKDDKTAKNKAA